MNIKRVSWKVSDSGVERLGVDITILKSNGTTETSTIRLDGNTTRAAYWGVTIALRKLNEMVGGAQ